MNDANTTFGPEACAERREDIALYAAGTLPPDEVQQLEAHFEAHPACRELLEAHRRVLKLVHEESLPGDAVDQAKVLRELKRRMAVESRVSLVPAQAALSRRGRIVWFVATLAVVIGICVGIAVSTYTPPTSPGGPEGPIGPKPVATYFAPGSAQGKPVAAGDRIEAQGGIARVVFTGGTDVRLRDGSAARVTGAKAMELLAGEAAINVPKARGGFTATDGYSRAEAWDEYGARYLFAMRKDWTQVCVAEGLVTVHDEKEGRWDVRKGDSASVSVGSVAPSGPFSPADAFGWVMEASTARLRCLLEAKEDEAGQARRLVATIENAGDQTVTMARYYPLGVNYQLQALIQDQVQAGFSRLNPMKIRKRKKDGSVEAVRPISGTLDLEPGDRYELELDASALPPATTSAVFHYLSFGEEGGGWGFALKSEPLKIVEPKAPEGKTPPKDDSAKTP